MKNTHVYLSVYLFISRHLFISTCQCTYVYTNMCIYIYNSLAFFHGTNFIIIMAIKTHLNHELVINHLDTNF